jgi:iron-sulfur cluster assembly protein
MITVTDAAQKKIIANLAKRGRGVGIRVGVRTTGCSGMAYVLEYVDEYNCEAGIINYAHDKFVVLVTIKDNVYLDGMEIDYVRQGLNEGFEFRNPNEKDRCGCGESFRI